MNQRHRFWRVLALEEFTDVQCVIVDHPMPSLAGYRIHRRIIALQFCPLLHQDLARYLSTNVAKDFCLDIYWKPTTKDVIWFSSGSYDLRTGKIMEIAARRIAHFDFVNHSSKIRASIIAQVPREAKRPAIYNGYHQTPWIIS